MLGEILDLLKPLVAARPHAVSRTGRRVNNDLASPTMGVGVTAGDKHFVAHGKERRSSALRTLMSRIGVVNIPACHRVVFLSKNAKRIVAQP